MERNIMSIGSRRWNGSLKATAFLSVILAGREPVLADDDWSERK